jgi:predicted membrane chloride channel (bestrophin family)
VQLHDRNPALPHSKLKLFGLIGIIVIAVTIPITLPHFTHPSMVYHILLHIASLVIAIFLSYIAVSAYLRDGRARLLFMALGFVTLAVLEILMLLSATDNLEEPIIPAVNVELSHIVLLVMITLFGIGVLKVN